MDRQTTQPLRIALFGGSFDPIHLGHLFIAKRAHLEIGLDKVIFIPAHCSPFKEGTSSTAACNRLAMVELAIRNLPWASASNYETALADTSYSWRTAEHFRRHLEQREDREILLYWLLGADQWNKLQHWNRAPYLAELVEFIVFCRDGETPEANPPFRGHFVDGTFPASSTRIRSLLAAGEHTGLPLDPDVLGYIIDNALYSSG